MKYRIAFILLLWCIMGGISRQIVLAGGPQLIIQTGPSAPVTVTALSPDGRLQATGEAKRVVRLWDWESGAELRRFLVGEKAVADLAFSDDSRRLLCVSGTQGTVFDVQSVDRLFSVIGPRSLRGGSWSSGERGFLLYGDDEVKTYSAEGRSLGHVASGEGTILDAAFSPDGSHILTGGMDGRALYIDSTTGQIQQSFEDNEQPITSVAISPDGNLALLGLRARRLRIMDLNSGRQIREVQTQGEMLSARFAPDGQSFLMTALGDATRWVALDGTEKGRFNGFVAGADFSGDGQQVATAEPFKAHLWNLKTSKDVAVCEGRVVGVYGTAFSPDSQYLATAQGDGSVQLFALGNGEQRRLDLNTERAICVAFSPDGTRLLAGGDRGALALFEISSGKRLFTLKGHDGSILGVGIGADGKTLLSAGQDGLLKFWNAADGAPLASLEASKGAINSLALDATRHRAVTGSADGVCTIWDIDSQQPGLQFKEIRGPVTTVAWSPDGTQIAAGSMGRTGSYLWEAQTGKVVRKIQAGNVWSLAFVPNSSRLLASGEEGSLYSIDGQGAQHQEGEWDARSAPLVVSPNGKWLAASGEDGLVRLTNLTTGRHLCDLTVFKGGDWAVVDEAGRFDTSLAGASASTTAGLLWSYQLAPIGLDQFRAGFMQTRLLGRLVDPTADPLPAVPTIDGIELFPRVAVSPPSATEKVAIINLRDNGGGGIGPVQVWVNGKLASPDARAGAQPRGGVLEIRYLPSENLLAPGAWNTLRVVAQNSAGTLASLPVESRWQAAARPGVITKTAPRLFVLAGGVSAYANPEYNLSFAAKDARDMAEALLVAGRRLFTPSQIKIRLFTGENAAEPAPPGIERMAATKANFEAAFKEIQDTARPEDVVVLYLAGHGAVMGQGRNVYYYMTQDAKSPDVNDPRWGSWSITGEDISNWLQHVAARKTVVVLDTCFSGNVAQTLAQAREAGVSQLRAFEQLQNVSGSYILAGCAQDAKSYEGSNLNQGFLTYALLEGMRGAALTPSAEGQVLDVEKWFNYAQNRVPDIAMSMKTMQRPQALSPKGESFPLGVLSAADTKDVPLRAQTLLITQPRLRDETAGDTLGLEAYLAAALRGEAANGAPFSFVDTTELEGSYRVSGSYRRVGGQVVWSLQMMHDGKSLLKIEDSGPANNPVALTKKMASNLRNAINKNFVALNATP